ncbi:type IIL restriction-modification enzyme MmeI [Methylotenera sp.]|uniref:type IIL restriction-modification enzyme MmeI n=1 Tax=Methylotenera sp. TaxID=2051956 RepID=UPI003456A3CF
MIHHYWVICLSIHMARMHILCGRLKSDFTYSASLVYNSNFPRPESRSGLHSRTAIVVNENSQLQGVPTKL